MEAEPQLHQAKKLIPPETPVAHTAGDAQWAFAQLSNGKAGPCIWSGGPAFKNKFGGAVEEQWKAVVGQRSKAPLSACAQAIAAAWTETATTCRVPQEDKDAEIEFLPKPGKDNGDAKNWRTVALLSYIGKAWADAPVRTLVPAVGKVNRSMPVLLTHRKEHARGSSHPEKRVREIHQLETPSKPPQLSP